MTYEVTNRDVYQGATMTNTETGHSIKAADYVTIGKSKNEWFVSAVLHNGFVELERQAPGRTRGITRRRMNIDALTRVSDAPAAAEEAAPSAERLRYLYDLIQSRSGKSVDATPAEWEALKTFNPNAEESDDFTPCNGAGLACTNPRHAHEAGDEDDRTTDGALLCRECGAPAHWDEAGDYQHDDPAAPGCFLIPAKTDGWPTAADLVALMRNLIDSGEAVDAEDAAECADELFPEVPDGDAERAAFHARAEAIMNEALAAMREASVDTPTALLHPKLDVFDVKAAKEGTSEVLEVITVKGDINRARSVAAMLGCKHGFGPLHIDYQTSTLEWHAGNGGGVEIEDMDPDDPYQWGPWVREIAYEMELRD
ncbi:hypothetical protein HYP71_gp098 [Arthrobacter phage KBurrousTX]|uniref:Uncharacterized protein n=1 Tax=Arthrobacter phage KBurrousTX TaxID=2315608 RepID=A0A386K9Y8_9CAUD|nr:hypothetical protein HYP71_gp098 [Arthrobacter phage KBurrousTX]AYD81592.1 hypothetical protein KBurrousTX_98 [Arthrobacter phage KBurrousTX]